MVDTSDIDTPVIVLDITKKAFAKEVLQGDRFTFPLFEISIVEQLLVSLSSYSYYAINIRICNKAS